MTPMQQCYQSDDDDDEDDSTRCDASKQGTSDPAAPTDSPLLSPDSPFCMGSGEREFMIRFSLLFVGLKPNDFEIKMSSFTHVNYLFIFCT